MDTHAVYIRLHRRRGYWRVAVIFPHSIRWRCYRQADCPAPDDVLARVRAGLSAPENLPDYRNELGADSAAKEDEWRNYGHTDDCPYNISGSHALLPPDNAHDPCRHSHRPESEDHDGEQGQQAEREDAVQQVDCRSQVKDGGEAIHSLSLPPEPLRPAFQSDAGTETETNKSKQATNPHPHEGRCEYCRCVSDCPGEGTPSNKPRMKDGMLRHGCPPPRVRLCWWGWL